MINVREIKKEDVNLIVNYWETFSDAHLKGMGVDLNKLPKKDDLRNKLLQQIITPINNKLSYALIWEYNNVPVGHTNANQILFGKQANMHLHLWEAATRKRGLGTALVKKSLPFYFNNLNLQVLYCEPYALNSAPNKTLKKCGFSFEKQYITIPGSINFEQKVNRWKLTRADYFNNESYLK